MTLLAYDPVSGILAADSGYTMLGLPGHPKFTATKFVTAGRFVFVATGDLPDRVIARELGEIPAGVSTHLLPEHFAGETIMAVDEDLKLWMTYTASGTAFFVRCDTGVELAMGSGDSAFRAFRRLGFDFFDAVYLAGHYGDYCGGPVEYFCPSSREVVALSPSDKVTQLVKAAAEGANHASS